MKTYPIPETLEKSYKGSGWALAAILDGQVVAIRYLSDIAPAISEQLGGDHDGFFIRQWIQTADAGPFVRELQALGEVSVGMCSCWEFTEL